MRSHKNTNVAVVGVSLILSLCLTACSGGSGDSDSSNSEGDVPVAYVKRPIDPNSREVAGNPTDSLISRPGSDLYIRVRSSPSASECNITSSYTQGQGDVSDPEVSADASKILFSMRGPTDETWDIWEADVAAIVRSGSCSGVALRRLNNDNGKSHSDPNVTWGDDVDPAYLPDGRIVFSSNRQEKTYRALGRKYIDEYEREPTVVLHTMNADGSNIQQISFNMSHDRNPTVLRSGEIMFSHWDHVGMRNQFTIFKINTDGTGLFVLFGAHSSVNSYLHPREMADGRIMSDAMPLQRTNEGGALVVLDYKNFGEVNQPAPMVSGAVAQFQPSVTQIDFGTRTSDNGRFTTPYPLWDGTNRALVSFTPGKRTEQAMETDPLTGQPRQVTVEKTPAYGVYVIDLASGQLRVVAFPRVNGQGQPVEMIVDPIPLMARSATGGGASVVPIETTTNSAMATRGVGRLTVKSIYDTDSENRMSNSGVLTAWEQDRSGNPEYIRIPMIAASTLQCSATQSNIARYPNCDTRSQVADLLTVKDPVLTPADRRAGRFVRIVRAVPTVSGMTRETIGETEFEMQQLLGYVPIEPDGSFSVEVPSDTPVAVSVTDAYGRAFQTHTSWLTVRPGETVTCKGCHSPRRSSPNALNQKGSTPALSIAGNNPNSALQVPDMTGMLVLAGPAIDGETMVETRLRLDTASMTRFLNPEYEDVWTYQDSSGNTITKASPISIGYASATFRGVTTAGIASAAERPYSVNVDGYTNQSVLVVNYLQHIQPILTRSCAGSSCHTGTTVIPDLSAGTSGSGRVTSYDELVLGRPVLNPDGTPQLRVEDDRVEVVRSSFVTPGLARSSKLITKVFPQGMIDPALFAGNAHATYLNPSEKRLISEWIDMGAQYYNDPCLTRDSSGRCTAFRAVAGLDEGVFTSTIQPLLLQQCAGCHVASGRGPNDPPFQAKRLVLTGSEGDFSVTASMVTNVCTPGSSYLLQYPTSTLTSTPVHAHIFDVGSPTYTTIEGWITAARAANGC